MLIKRVERVDCLNQKSPICCGLCSLKDGAIIMYNEGNITEEEVKLLAKKRKQQAGWWKWPRSST